MSVRLQRILAGVLMLTGLVLWTQNGFTQRPKKRPLRKAPPAKKQTGAIRPVARIAGFKDWVSDVAVSPEGKHLAIGSDGVVRIVDLQSRRTLFERKTAPGYIRALAFSPDGKRLAVGGYEWLELWETETFRPVLKLEGHTGQVTDVAFSPDGKRLVSGSLDETARIWDTETGQEIRRLRDFEYPVNGVTFSPDGQWIATATGDEYRVTRPGPVRLWNAGTGEEKTWRITENGKPRITRLVEHLKAANSVAFSPDGRTLISTSYDEKVNVYDVTTGKARGYFDGHGRPTNDALFLPDGVTVASAGGGRFKKRYFVMLWNSRDGEKLATLEGHRGPVVCLALSPDGRLLVSGSHDKSVILWDISSLIAQKQNGRREAPVIAPKPARKPVARQLPRLTVGSVTEPSVYPRQSRVFFLAADNRSAEGNRSAQKEGTRPRKPAAAGKKVIRIGIIGLDTSHVPAFTRVLNDPNAPPDVAGCRVVAAYPKGSPDIPSSVSRVPKYTAAVKAMGVKIVDSIPELLTQVDAVLLETNDGRPHLEQVLPVLKAGKPVFIDKPIAGSLADAIAIFEASRKYKTPVFSSSSLRYMPGAQKIRAGAIGTVQSAEAYSPAHLEKTHPDLFWYGIHGVETLFTMMGPGCETVQRTVHTPLMDEVVGHWKGGRVGIFRGYRKGSGKGGYGGKAKGTKGELSAGKYAGYRPLVVDIVRFFRTGKPPVSQQETLEIYAFMEAADESKRRGGEKVSLKEVMEKARQEAARRLAELDR